MERERGRSGKVKKLLVKELPLIVIVLVIGVLMVPMARGLRGIETLAGEFKEVRDDWTKTVNVQLRQALLASETIDDSPEWAESGVPFRAGFAPIESELSYLAKIEQLIESNSLKTLARFSPTLETELAELSRSLHEINNAPESLSLVGRLTLMDRAERRLTAVLERLQSIEYQRERTYGTMVLFVVLLAAAFAVLYGYQTVRVHALDQDRETRDRIAALTLKVQENERQNLARELHDGVGQQLAIARMAVDKVSDFATKKLLKDSLTRAMQDIRTLALQMRPIGENERWPAEAIRDLATLLQSDHPVQFFFEVDRRIELDWSHDALKHLYRIAQETFSNIVRHAKATRAVVVVKVESGNALVFQACDNGRGLGDAVEGLGRLGMRERAELLGGRITWTTPPAGGTMVRLEVPMNQKKRGNPG